MTSDLDVASVAQLSEMVRAGVISPVELAEHYLAQIRIHDGEVGAFCTVDEDQVREEARRAERARRDGDVRPLLGIPVAIKDLIFTRGLRTTGGSRFYQDFVPDVDDVAVARLRDAGAVVLGKTNTAEFGFSANQTKNDLFGATRNPLAVDRSPGGSSGGSAAAVAAGLAPVALASDGGGSVRVPSSFCGVYGIKPSFGRVPLYPGCRDERLPGLSGWESLEHIGPVTRTVADAALLLDVISGPDVRDRHSLVPLPEGSFVDQLRGAPEDLDGIRVAWSSDWAGEEAVEPDVRRAVEAAVAQLEALGCEVVADAPLRAATRDDFGALVALDCSPAATRAMLEARDVAVSPRWAAMVSRDWTFLQLAGAASARRRMYASMTEFFTQYDAFVTPTTPFPALPLGQDGPATIDGVDVREPSRAVMGFCYPFNITGHPAASVPCGYDHSGLPIGLQIVSGMLRDDVVLRISAAIERTLPL